MTWHALTKRMTVWYKWYFIVYDIYNSRKQRTERMGGTAFAKTSHLRTDILNKWCPKNILPDNDYTWSFVVTLSEKGAGDGDGCGDGQISPEHPCPIRHAPRDNNPIRANRSLRYMEYTKHIWRIYHEYIYIYIFLIYIYIYMHTGNINMKWVPLGRMG